MVETDERISGVVDQLVMRGWHRSGNEGEPHSWSVGIAAGLWPRKVERAKYLFATVSARYSLCLTGDPDDGSIWGWAAVVHRPGRLPLIVDRWLGWPGLNSALLLAWDRWQNYRATDGEVT